MLSIPKLAEKFELKDSFFRKELVKQDYIAKVDDEWQLTPKGEAAGGSYFNYFGPKIVFPESFKISISQDNASAHQRTTGKKARLKKIPFSEPLKTAMFNKIREPIFQRSGTAGWQNHVAEQILDNSFTRETSNFHRKTLLEQGQTDFTKGNNGLNTHELSLLYCYYYFQMHFSSTVAVLRELRELLIREIFNESNKILFVDVGCGPFTSGIAFLYFMRLAEKINKKKSGSWISNLSLEYCGIDTAKSLILTGKNIYNEYCNETGDNKLSYSKIRVAYTSDNLTKLVGNSDKNSPIILNCCYLFASQSLDIDAFSSEVRRLINNNPDRKILLIYQNAPTVKVKVTRNYNDFVSQTSDMIKDKTAVEDLKFSFIDELKSSANKSFTKKVRYNIIKYY